MEILENKLEQLQEQFVQMKAELFHDNAVDKSSLPLRRKAVASLLLEITRLVDSDTRLANNPEVRSRIRKSQSDLRAIIAEQQAKWTTMTALDNWSAYLEDAHKSVAAHEKFIRSTLESLKAL